MTAKECLDGRGSSRREARMGGIHLPRTIGVEKEMDEARQRQKRGFRLQIILILVLCLVPALALFRDAGASAFNWQSDRLTLTYPDGTGAELLYADVLSVEYRDTFDFGSSVTGGTMDKCRYGLWHNGEFGDYQSCCHVDIPGCIVFTTKDTRFVVSYESADTTLALYESVRDTLLQEGYLTD